MTKFTRSDRLEAALAVEAGDSIASVAGRFGMSKIVVARSLNLYREYGEASFQQMKKASYTAAQKLMGLETMHAQGMSCEAAAVKFGINGSTSTWKWEQRNLKTGSGGGS